MNLKVYKMRPDAKLPVRAYKTDAGMDLFYCPDGTKKLYDCTKDFFVPPHESRLLPTGIKVEVPYGYMMEIKNKSGIASKKQLLVGACVVDCGYNGEVYVNLHNIGPHSQSFKPGEKIAQAVLVPISHCNIEEALEDKLNKKTERGSGGFGSTGDE